MKNGQAVIIRVSELMSLGILFLLCIHIFNQLISQHIIFWTNMCNKSFNEKGNFFSLAV